MFKPSPVVPPFNEYLTFQGISVDEHGEQYYLDVHIAGTQRHRISDQVRIFARPGLLHSGHGAVLRHISGVVDIPNACATLWLPTDIFDFDAMPCAAGPTKHVMSAVDICDVAGQVMSARAEVRAADRPA